MKKSLSLIILLLMLVSGLTKAQDSIRFKPRLILEFPVLELPHLQKAAAMRYNKRTGQLAGGITSPKGADYLRSYESLSMQQALAVTKNLHTTNYYFNNKLWNRWIPATTSRKALLNRLAANLSAGIIDYALAYQLMVFGPVWLHEEFHRNGISHQCISSFNDTYYRLGGKGTPGGSVTQVRDEDLVRFKAAAPQEMVRSFAAGIEAQYEMVRHMRKDQFFSGTHYANAVMNILITKQAVDYVNQINSKNYDEAVDSMNSRDGTDISKRDFVGWDFPAWVYDLFRPNEPYTSRGQHPSGVGIRRGIEKSMLTAEELDYLKKMGRLQYINYLSPAMLSIGRIKVNNNFAFSFAGRHLLNSFGYDIGADLFLDIHGSQWLVGIHGYHNHERSFPGIEVEKPDWKIKIGEKNIPLQIRAMLWLQPKDQQFRTSESEAGGLLQIKGRYEAGPRFSIFADLEGKTNGWVAGNPYLQKNFTFRTGFMWDIH